MSKWVGKKQILMAVLVVALGVAVYLNYYFASANPITTGPDAQTGTTDKNLGDSQFVNAGTDTQDPAPTEPANYFDSARQNRENARQEALDIIQDMIQDVKVSDEVQAEALEKVAAITQAIEQENAIEDLIRAKGFEDCVVYIEEDNCHVVVKAEKLEQSQTVQIQEIILTQSSIPAQNINIVTVNS